MNIPAHFEFHYVQNGVKKSVTLFTASLFQTNPQANTAWLNQQPQRVSEQRAHQ
jgi:hypothetical protein